MTKWLIHVQCRVSKANLKEKEKAETSRFIIINTDQFKPMEIIQTDIGLFLVPTFSVTVKTRTVKTVVP